jgi:hypothetical protein
MADAPGGAPGPSGAAARICRTASGSSTVAITRSRPPQRRQANTSIASTRRSNVAHGRRPGDRGASWPAGSFGAAGNTCYPELGRSVSYMYAGLPIRWLPCLSDRRRARA